jgi:hypothetical protein
MDRAQIQPQEALGRYLFSAMDLQETLEPRIGTSHSNHISNAPAAKALILQLPEELLVLIVEFAAGFPNPQAEVPSTIFGDKYVVLKLSKVCHRLRRIAQPLLFRNIRLGYPYQIVPPSPKATKLHRTLEERTDLQQHCE